MRVTSRHCAGNYKDGALEEGEHTCDFNAQFEERRCRLKLQLDATLCNDSVRLSFVGGNPPLDMVCNQPLPDSLTLWSIGNHFIAGKQLVSVLCSLLALFLFYTDHFLGFHRVSIGPL